MNTKPKRLLVNLLHTVTLFFVTATGISQTSDHFSISSESIPALESKALKDLFRFEDIGYYSIKAKGAVLTGKNYMFIAKVFVNGKVSIADTLVDSKSMHISINEDELNFTVMSRKIRQDSVKMMFFLERFSTTKIFKTSLSDTYSLIDPFNGKAVAAKLNEQTVLFAYSLPYQDPRRPNALFYCELSKDGIPPSEWGEKFGIEHYITIELQIH